jgi:hypothetical protein
VPAQACPPARLGRGGCEPGMHHIRTPEALAGSGEEVDDQAHNFIGAFQNSMHADVTPAAFRRGFPDVTVAAVKLQAFVANSGAASVIVHGARYTSPYTPTGYQRVIIPVNRRGQSVGPISGRNGDGLPRHHQSPLPAEGGTPAQGGTLVMGWCLTHAHDITCYSVRA